MAVDNKFVEGVLVGLFESGFGGPTLLRQERIAKVFTNGNFRLEGERGQWKPFRGNVAHRCQRDNWDRTFALVWTPELAAEEEEKTLRRDRMSRLQKAYDALRRLNDVPEGALSDLEAFVRERSGKSQEAA